MSTLTKLFVVLLIVCSLLLTAGVVVFVNKQENFVKLLDAQNDKIALLRKESETFRNAASAAQSQLNQAIKDHNNSLAGLQNKLNQAQSDTAAKAAELAKLESRVATLDAAVTTHAEALKISQTNLGTLQARADELAKSNDSTRTQNAELVGANTDLQKQLDSATREVEFLQEQKVQLSSALESARNLLAQNKIQFSGKASVPAPADLKGVIRTTKVLDGITYATISIGSADKVQKGMEFNVIDRDSNLFLGKLRIETVDSNEAFGRLEGPRVSDVKPDNEVLSRL